MPAGHHRLAYGTRCGSPRPPLRRPSSMRRFVRVVANSDYRVVAGIQWSARTSPISPRPSHRPSRSARVEYITATTPCRTNAERSLSGGELASVVLPRRSVVSPTKSIVGGHVEPTRSLGLWNDANGAAGPITLNGRRRDDSRRQSTAVPAAALFLRRSAAPVGSAFESGTRKVAGSDWGCPPAR